MKTPDGETHPIWSILLSFFLLCGLSALATCGICTGALLDSDL